MILKIIRRICSKIEGSLSLNWFNPLLTLWLNFRSMPFKDAIKLPIWVYGRPKIYNTSGRIVIKSQVVSGMIRFNQMRPWAPSLMTVQSEINNSGTIIFHGKGEIGTGNKIKVVGGAVLELGNHFKIADMCNIGCTENISIGDQSRIAHRCQVLDSNYHYIANFLRHNVLPKTRPIRIGCNCWICNSSTVVGGSIIPDYTIVGSNSLVNHDYSTLPINSLIGGCPAKLISAGIRRINNSGIEQQIRLFYKNNPTGTYEIPADADMDDYSTLK